MSVRTRFAPSPTGYLHIGSVRTALYAWAVAKKNNGSFILRIEDTDRERYVPNSIKFIIQELNWLGLQPTEGPSESELIQVGEDIEGLSLEWSSHGGPYIQSLRKDFYKRYAEELLQAGFAYRCECTPEMLEKERREQILAGKRPGYSGRCRYINVSPEKPHAIRLKLPQNFSVTANDEIRGKLKFENPPLSDPVLLKSDGFPTYHLAVVVDDHLMKITHVLRGEEWISTFPIHWYLYDLFGWEKPKFLHLPVILGEDGKKLSKRHGAQTTAELREEGFLPSAIINALALIGWTHSSGLEIFSVDEFLRDFSLEKVHSASGMFSPIKLKRINHEHFKLMRVDEFLALIQKNLGLSLRLSESYVNVLKERTHTLKDLSQLLCFLIFPNEYDFQALEDIDKQLIISTLELFKKAVNENLSRDELQAQISAISDSINLPKKHVFKILRVAILRRMETPPLIDTIQEFGFNWTIDQINRFLSEFR